MNEHDELESTVAGPSVIRRPAPSSGLQPQPGISIGPQPVGSPRSVDGLRGPAVRPIYRFGNPFAYALRRLLAFTLDFVVLSAVATMLLYGLIAINPFTGLPNNSQGGFDATLGMGMAFALVLTWLLESLFGTTLGKLALSLHVYVPGRRFVGLGRGLIRNLVRPIDLLLIGPVLAMLPGHRRLGDLLGGTLVAQSPLRAFAPLVGWVLIVALVGLPFAVAGGMVTVLAVGTAFLEFIPPLIGRVIAAIWQLAAGWHPVPAAG